MSKKSISKAISTSLSGQKGRRSQQNKAKRIRGMGRLARLGLESLENRRVLAVDFATVVPNLGFEGNSGIPNNIEQMELVNCWEQLGGASPEYLHTSGYLGGLGGHGTAPSPINGSASFLGIGAVSGVLNEYAVNVLPVALVQNETYLFNIDVGTTSTGAVSGAFDGELVIYGLLDAAPALLASYAGELDPIETFAGSNVVELLSLQVDLPASTWASFTNQSFVAPGPIEAIVIGSRSSDFFSYVLVDASAATFSSPSADFNGDGFVSGSDFLTWQRGYGTSCPLHSEGDADFDGDVDGDDLAVWQLQYGTSGASLNLVADFDSNGSVSAEDYITLQQNLGMTSAAIADGDANGDGVVDALDVLAYELVYDNAHPETDTFQSLDSVNAAMSLQPGEILVSTLNDEVDDDYSLGDLSLREALIIASQTVGADTIIFAPGLAGGTITMADVSGDGYIDPFIINDDVTIEGLGRDQLTIAHDNSTFGAIFVIGAYSSASVEIMDLTLEGGSSGLLAFTAGTSLTASNLAVTGASSFAVLASDQGVSVVVADCEVSGNVHGVFITDGAVGLIERTTISDSAGIGLQHVDANVIVVDSTLSNNQARGVFALRSFGGTSSLSIINSTISGNGIWGIEQSDDGVTPQGSPQVRLINSTVTNNEQGVSVASEMLLQNTIVAGNDLDGGGPTDVVGTLDVSSSHNLLGQGGSGGLFDDRSGPSGNIVLTANENLSLLPLVNNGGPTLTHALLPSSLAVNRGSDGLAVDSAGQPLTTDQRGSTRLVGTVDIGAVELGAVSVSDRAPQVVSVEVSGSNSTHAPYVFNDVVGSGEQLRTAPVGGADTITIAFSESVTVQQSDLRLIGLRTADLPTVSNFTYDASTLAASWTFAAPFIADQYLIELADSVVDGDSNALDGEWINPAALTTTNTGLSTFPSGNGAAGGKFEFVFTNLPGDFNRDNTVSGSDFLIWQVGFGSANPLFGNGDANGDGAVNSTDLGLWSNNYGAALVDLALAADFDDDYDVDGSDFLEWQQHFGQSVTPGEDGDANGDGFVDGNDLDIWSALYGTDLDVLN